MNVTNAPVPALPADLVPDDVLIYYRIILGLFAIVFFVGIHYWVHVRQHLIPPAYVFWLREQWQRWTSR